MSQITLRKILRWAVRLSTYNHTCVHIKGIDNVWADLLGRWSSPKIIRRLVCIPVLPSSSDSEFEWPSPSQIASEQSRYASSRPPHLTFDDGLCENPTGSVWIPGVSNDLQLHLCIISHTGPNGHRGSRSATRVLRKSFFWSTLDDDVSSFVRGCIHCLSTTGGEKVPQPFSPAVHGTSPNDLL